MYKDDEIVLHLPYWTKSRREVFLPFDLGHENLPFVSRIFGSFYVKEKMVNERQTNVKEEEEVEVEKEKGREENSFTTSRSTH